ncbi:MAG: ABC transporter ATP-binding protein [Anaerolineae bacterium]|nr:ABC transporter ATP-binding protein [Anaerolineae bacterium]
MLRLEAVSAYYGQVQALREVSLQVNAGEIVAVIGSNGAGKTTLMNAISGLVPVRSGEITLEGQPIVNLAPERIVRLGISQVPERRQVFSTMSVMDNLILGAYHRYRRESKETIHSDLGFVLEIFPRLKDRARQTAGTLSGGEQQMVALARAWMSRPKLLLMDEPSLGLAPLIVKEIFRVSSELRERGMTILLVEQNARAALDLADRAYVMESGQVALEGAAAELAVDERVRKAYLGGNSRP